MYYSRRKFITATATAATALALPAFACTGKAIVEVDAHLWVYASRYPPDWDCTPILDDVFADLKAAGFARIEMMESIIRHEGAVDRIKELIQKNNMPVGGCSYYGDMWDKEQHNYIEDDISLVLERLQSVGATMIGLTTGDAEHKKTEGELDVQADMLKKIMAIAAKHNIQPNMHNHTFEMADDMHDFKGTIARLPELKLGPDLNWLVRAKVDPVWYIKTYGNRMVYMHIRDQDANGKWTEAVGEGVIDYKAIAKALHDINYNKRAAVELAFDAPPSRSIREDWSISRKYVKTVFGW